MVEGPYAQVLKKLFFSQAFVINPDLTVEAALKDAERAIGAPAKITGFARIALGEAH